MVPLSTLPVGQTACVLSIETPDVALQMLRLGVSVGDEVLVVAKVPGNGPVVLMKDGQELALGRDVAHYLTVAPV